MQLNKQKIIGVLFIVAILFVVTSVPFQEFASIPHEVRMFEGKTSNFPFSFLGAAEVVTTASDGEEASAETFKHNEAIHALKEEEGFTIQALHQGTAEVQLKLGQIPLKKVKVNVLPEIKVYPGGQSIGVKLSSVGVVVVGHHFIDTQSGRISPGEDASIKVGDIILEMNGIKLDHLDQIGGIVDEAGRNGEKIAVQILRGKEKLNLTLQPAKDAKEDKYRLGLYIRNSAAGVGTLTFYHPETGSYGALGHVISDMDTQKPIIVGNGSIVNSSVSSIEKGESGQPGEKYARFVNENRVLGDIKKNTPFGIFGHMKEKPDKGLSEKAIPIALNEEVEKGPAQIYTVVEGEKVEKYDIEIVEVMAQKFPATKGLVLKVTDPKLLEKTGGIVQGMSGSPIIQNGKLVGAVTHVFINDPTSGYGCFIEWMLEDAGVPIQPASLQQAKAS
ncbi:SpoIVB peptidase [Bacillus horti]|uniref:Stage IV sporulation protein B n=1 Tax=Caldalkalibacillus horti TaxID=77523 RepID=A0ABT9W199_9BACI|nr:SpoIVB peptidase [Bacillus horti]MDQ0166864.1 stage IV sporulation protein B [Bacillus horti]